MATFITRSADGFAFRLDFGASGRSKRRAPLFAPAICLTLICLLLPAKSLFAGPEPRPEARAYGRFDFATCVRYALAHSTELLENRLDIQIRSADLKDAHAELLPNIQLASRYFLAKANSDDIEDTKPFSVSVFARNWNPYLALLKIKSRGILVDIAETAHYKKIADGIGEMAKLFYRISIVDKEIQSRKQTAGLRGEKLRFARALSDQGKIDPLAERGLRVDASEARLRIEALEATREGYIDQLKLLMGYHPDYYLRLDTRDAAKQILDGFNGHLVTFSDIQGGNLALKIKAKQEQLQSNRITGAYVRIAPKPMFYFESVNNQVDRSSGLNVAFGIDYTLWDGFRAVRDIKRQKMIARKMNLGRKQLSREIYVRYKKLRNELELSDARDRIVREQVKIAELQEERTFVRYKNGEAQYSEYVDSRLRKVAARLQSLNSRQDRIMALIELAGLAGGLNRYNAAIRH